MPRRMTALFRDPPAGERRSHENAWPPVMCCCPCVAQRAETVDVRDFERFSHFCVPTPMSQVEGGKEGRRDVGSRAIRHTHRSANSIAAATTILHAKAATGGGWKLCAGPPPPPLAGQGGRLDSCSTMVAPRGGEAGAVRNTIALA
eukprot:gene12672-biopygen11608